MIDAFKINWTERSRDLLTTSATGYSYQISSWTKAYFKEYNPKSYNTMVITKIENEDNTVTVTVSRKLDK
jgi:hypothetical protein